MDDDRPSTKREVRNINGVIEEGRERKNPEKLNRPMRAQETNQSEA